MRSDSYTFIFAMAVCIVCSVLLAICASSLKPYQERNMAIEKKKNILMSLSLCDASGKMSSDDVEKVYKEKITEKVVSKTGQEMSGKTIVEIAGDDQYLGLYQRTDNGAIAIPIQGMGLWDMIKGYLALEKDGRTVNGITFYEQMETAGLGAEIVKPSFTNTFIGKDILNSDGKLVSITVAKGKASDMSGVDLKNAVDGISGATMTCRFVSGFVKSGLKTYQPVLKTMWSQSTAPEPAIPIIEKPTEELNKDIEKMEAGNNG
ncbi:MAG: FMN-binding protein [Fibrobacteria bacterium]|nr:FMN-binding protein [Fibrobacteria bacterium]